MATSSWSSGCAHANDADFRAWGSELSTKLQAMAGLVKTADTGQINWTTVTRPGVSTNGGYEIYYLNDSLHATAPIYIKIWYGTGTAATAPRIQFEVGTGSNGAGLLTGLGLGSAQNLTTVATAGTATAVASYLCVASGFLGLMWKAGTISGFLVIQRTCDGDGTLNGKGAFLHFRTATTWSVASLRYEATAVASAITTTGFVGLIPAGLSNSALQNGDKQIYLHWGNFPDMRPLWGTGQYVASEFAQLSTLTVALIGATTRTYVCLGALVPAYGNANDVLFNMLMLWE